MKGNPLGDEFHQSIFLIQNKINSHRVYKRMNFSKRGFYYYYYYYYYYYCEILKKSERSLLSFYLVSRAPQLSVIIKARQNAYVKLE